jgi:RNA polymerase sigma-70 factor (sigma-E family)
MRDLQAFEQYVLARWSTFHRLAILLTASESASQDLMQTTLEKAYVAWPKISAMEAPDAYVRRIMVNSLVSTHRLARNRREFAAAEPPEQGTASREDEVLDHEVLWPLVCALPTRQRAVIVLRYYEDLSEREIADALGCSVGTVKSTAHDAMTALRRGITAVRVPEGSDL